MFSSKPWTLDRIFRFFLFLSATAIAFWLLRILSDVLIPFVVAFLLAYILDPLVSRIQKKTRSRGVAVSIVLIATVAFVFGLGYMAFQPVQAQVNHATQLFSKAVTDAQFSEMAKRWLPADLWESMRQHLGNGQWLATLQSQSFWSSIGNVASKMAPGAFAIVSGTFELIAWIVSLTMVAIYLFFMLLEFSTLRQTLADLVPSGQRDNMKDFLGQLDSTMSSYFRAQGLISLILAVCFAIGFSLIGLPLGILFGALTGLATMVPYLQIATVPFALLLCLLQSIDQGVPFWQAALLVLLVYGICQILQDFILVPRILGNISGLSPVMIMLSLSVWGKLLGMLGLILAIPLTCLALVYYRRVAQHDS